MVQFTLAASFRPSSVTPPGRFFDPIFAGEQVPWGRIFNIFWEGASSSLLLYSLLWLARFEPRSVIPTGRFFDPIFAGEQVPWSRILKIFRQSASSSTLWCSLLWLARFHPRSATHQGRFFDPIFAGSKSLGVEFLTYSDRARRVIPYGTVYFGSLASNPARPTLREGFLIPYFAGE